MKLSSLVVAVGCCLLVASVQADVQFVSIDDLGSPGSAVRLSPSIANAISPDGKNIVGTWLVSPNAIPPQGWIALDSSGVATDLGLPAGVVRVIPTGINNSQVLVGWLRDAPDNAVAFYARPPFGPAPFTAVPIPGLTANSQATAINAGGAIAGYDSSGSNGASRSFVFTPDSSGTGGKLDRINAFQPQTPNQAYAINGSGTVAGWAMNVANERQAFVAQPPDGPVSQPAISVRNATGDLVAAHWSEARAINASGDIAGCAAAAAGTVGDCSGTITSTGSGIQAFMVHNGNAIALGVPSGFDESFALGISDHGLVVGTAHGDSGSSAFLWYFDNGQLKPLNLTTLLPQNGLFSSLLTATAITETMVSTTATTETLLATVVGQGLTSDADPVAHAFSLQVQVTVAVPEPETWTLLLAGLAFVGWTGRQRLRGTITPAG